MKARNQRRGAANRSAEHRLLSVPTFGLLKGSVGVKDLAVGMAGGMLGLGGVKMLLNKAGLLASLPPLAQRFMPLISGTVTGVALYYADKKLMKKGKGKAYMAGAIAAGAAVQAWQELQAQFPDTFNDYVYLPSYGGRGMGLLVDRPMNGYRGILVDRPASSGANLSALHALNLANVDNDAI